MKNPVLILLIIAISVACKEKNQTEKEEFQTGENTEIAKNLEVSKPEVQIIEEDTETINQEDSSESEFAQLEIDSSDFNEEDCIFDQTTQTDEFLKDIEEFENYQWNPKKRTAKIVLENGDSLFIFRGGCYHYSVSSTFHIYNDTIYYSNWEKVFEKVLWVAKLLENEYHFDRVEAEIENESYVIQEYEPYDQSITFKDELLINRHYNIYRRIEANKTIIEFSFMVN